VGSYRFLLAWCVVIEHLATGVTYVSHTGMFAVVGFYVLSGYLITRSLNDVYAFQPIPFWSNRFLRLYPVYFVLLALGLPLVLGTPRAAEFFPEVWKKHPEFSDWIGLLTIVPMGISPMQWTFRPIPSIWSVGVELLNYGVLFAFVARRKYCAVLMLVAAACYHIVSLLKGDEIGARYFPFYAALLPFALGAVIYFLTSRSYQVGPKVALLLCAPAAANCVMAGVIGGAQNSISFNVLFYLNLVFQGIAVAGLATLRPQPSGKIDSLLGDLSYPIFLCHWLVGYIIALVLFPGEWRGIGLMLATIVCSTGVAYVICLAQDALLEPLRSRIRGNAAVSNRQSDSAQFGQIDRAAGWHTRRRFAE